MSPQTREADRSQAPQCEVFTIAFVHARCGRHVVAKPEGGNCEADLCMNEEGHDSMTSVSSCLILPSFYWSTSEGRPSDGQAGFPKTEILIFTNGRRRARETLHEICGPGA